MTDIGGIVQFSYERIRAILEYHIDIIPFGVLIGVGIVSFILGKHVRRSNITILFLIWMGIALIAAIARQYPLGFGRQNLLWGPLIVVAFSQCVPVAAELIRRTKRLSLAPVNPILNAAVVLAIGSAGVLAIANEDNLYSEPTSLEIAIENIESRKDDKDIILWTAKIHFRREGMIFMELHYGENTPSYYRLCERGACLSSLLELQENRRLWLGVYTLGGATLGEGTNDIIVLDKLAHIAGNARIIDENFTEFIHLDSFSIYFIRDSSTVLDLYQDMTESFPDILDSLDSPVLKRDDYEVYLSESALLYVTENCEAEQPEFFMHIFPVTLNDLPAEWQALQYENQGFFFADNSIQLRETCVALRSLPEYPILRIVTGQFSGENRIWYGAVDFSGDRVSTEIDGDFLTRLGSPVLMNSGWDVYLSDRDVIYASGDPCEFSLDAPSFFLHVYPVDVGDLPVESQPHGFENRDFFSPDYASELEGGCVVVRALPAYPVARVETGQYLLETGEKLWKGVIGGESLAE